jgi:hypothetical protein
MNHTYRLVWNDRRSAYIPVPEFARSRGKKSFRLRALSAAVLASLAVTAHALPGDGQVSAGQGIVASTVGLSNSDLLSGRYTFAKNLASQLSLSTS